MTLAAVMAFYDSLTLPETCPVFLDAAPVKDSLAAAIDLPYAVITDWQTVPTYEEECHPLERTTFTLTVYAPTLVRAEAVVEAIKYNGSRPGLRKGFDNALDLPDLDTDTFRFLHLVRTRETAKQLPARGTSARLIFARPLAYDLLCQRLV